MLMPGGISFERENSFWDDFTIISISHWRRQRYVCLPLPPVRCRHCCRGEEESGKEVVMEEERQNREDR